MFGIDTTALSDWLAAHPLAALGLGMVGLLVGAGLAYLVTRRYLLRLLERAIRRTKLRWDDALLENRVLRRASLFAPLLVLAYSLPLVPHLPETVDELGNRVILALFVVAGALTAIALLDTLTDVYSTLEIARDRPIKGYVQVVKIVVALAAVILVIATLLDRSPWVFLTGLGAMTAVLLLVFRDTILSFVASIQLATNDMIRLGDWIEMPKYGADGDVIDIALHTVKVQNWDKTITTVPTWALIQESFKNWRGMQESGGRRIKRSIILDTNTVRFLDDEDLERFSRFVLLRDYMEEKRAELERYNREVGAEDGSVVANARRLTNLGTFRAYVAAYLRQNPHIYTEGMTFLVRQLAPGPEGVPIEIYVFTKDTRWAVYEAIQADIFDHLLAIVPEFGLRVFQQPSGRDLEAIGEAVAGRAR